MLSSCCTSLALRNSWSKRRNAETETRLAALAAAWLLAGFASSLRLAGLAARRASGSSESRPAETN